jgi:hypothetical protein
MSLSRKRTSTVVPLLLATRNAVFLGFREERILRSFPGLRISRQSGLNLRPFWGR